MLVITGRGRVMAGATGNAGGDVVKGAENVETTLPLQEEEGDRMPRVPARWRVRSHTSSAAEDSDADFEGPAYRRRLIGIYQEILGTLSSLPASLRTMPQNMEQSSSNLCPGFAKSMETILPNMDRAISPSNTTAVPTIIDPLLTALTAVTEPQSVRILAFGVTIDGRHLTSALCSLFSRRAIGMLRHSPWKVAMAPWERHLLSSLRTTACLLSRHSLRQCHKASCYIEMELSCLINLFLFWI
ncbi:uncharacterized protein [Heptranchias perlo]|uniref:uncharacterized protein n=1 Tax=Heptranchias perlo TaxID=212740 RepID=UPI00355A399D